MMIRHILLCGIALTSLCAAGAQAQQVTTKQPFTVKINGDIRYFFGHTSASPKSNGAAQFFDDGFESGIDVRLTVTAAAQADNGMRYGFYARLRDNQDKLSSTGAASDTVGMDRKMVYLEGGFGRLELGDFYGSSTTLEVLAPTADYGFIQDAAGSMKWMNYGSYFSTVWNHEDTAWTRITYLTPKFSGFQAGLSYAPDYNESGRNLTRDNARYNDLYEVAAKYENTFGSVKVAVGAAYAWANNTDTSYGKYRVADIGATIGYAGFTLGAGYWDNNGATMANLNGQEQDVHGWNTALAYETGPWVAGLSYTSATRELPASRFRDVQTQMWTLGGGYKLAPGLLLQVDLAHMDVEDWSSTSGNGTYFENKGWIAASRVNLKF